MRIAIVGTGYVGLTTGVCLASMGHEMSCVDIVPERVTAINNRKVPFYEPGLAEMLSKVVASRRLYATTDLVEAITRSEVTFITVGTPQSDQGIDLSYIATAARQIGYALRHVSDYHLVVLKSTVVPGTTDTLVRNLLEEGSGLQAGEFGLCMNPEFLREGSAIHDFMNPDRIVIGQWDERSGQTLGEVYKPFDCPRIFTTLRNAEMIKYAANALLATLVSFSNEIAALCEVTPDTDINVVMQGVHLDRRLSPVINGEQIKPGILNFLWAGCGFGGSCLPKDVNALRAYARERAITPYLLDAVMTINSKRPAILEKLAEEALGSLRGAVIAVLGLAFKPGTDDLRESPALTVIKLLLDKGAIVKAYDPFVASIPPELGFDNLATLCNTPEEVLRDSDTAIVVTAYPEFAEWDWTTLCNSMRRQIIIDGRNILRKVSWPKKVRYMGIGQVN
ncbi:MAG TPA: UDP-glucose/GDP-mannose dehydrogenase family protein [Candidatus Limnocylindrales bacterium]|nr:UDP-glucose/GDP-mannose dehydrogenase family protein [Candidatus Limnocylindrales bacterium]